MLPHQTARNYRCHNTALLGTTGINRCIITTLSTGPKTNAMLGPPNCGMLGTADAKNRCLRSAKTGWNLQMAVTKPKDEEGTPERNKGHVLPKYFLTSSHGRAPRENR